MRRRNQRAAHMKRRAGNWFCGVRGQLSAEAARAPPTPPLIEETNGVAFGTMYPMRPHFPNADLQTWSAILPR